jgi:hypothetical protein
MTELKVTGFIWLDEIVEKLAGKHQVDPNEVEELFEDNPRFRFVENGNRCRRRRLRRVWSDQWWEIFGYLLHQ